MDHLDLFSGIGGFALAARWAGFETVAFCEIEKYCQRVLRKNFGEGILIHDDIKQLDGTRYAGTIDLLTGGFPCQPYSIAGKRRGNADPRALWHEMRRVIHEVKPTWIVGENVANFANMGLDDACADLENEGYEVQPFIIPAVAVGAPHLRKRVFILAQNTNASRLIHGKSKKEKSEIWGQWYSSARSSDWIYRQENVADTQRDEHRRTLERCDTETCGISQEHRTQHNAARWIGETGQGGLSDSRFIPHAAFRQDERREPRDLAEAEGRGQGCDNATCACREDVSNATSRRLEEQGLFERYNAWKYQVYPGRTSKWWAVEPAVGRVANGIPNRVDRLKGLGNAVVPQQVYPILKAIADLVDDNDER